MLMPRLIPVAILMVSFAIPSLQNVALQLPAIVLDPEARLRCREVLSRSSWRLSRPTPSAFLAWHLSEHRLLSASLHRQF